MYLKKSENGCYSFRWRIPYKDRSLFNGKTEIVRSLKTKSARLANKRAKKLSAGLVLLKERLGTVTKKDVDTIVNDWLNERLEWDLNARIQKSSLQGASQLPGTKTLAVTEKILELAKDDLAKLKTGNFVDLASGLINEEINEDREDHKRLLFQLLRANVQLFKTFTERNKGIIDFNVSTTADQIQKFTYQEAVDDYLPILHQKSKKRAKNKDKDKEPRQYSETKKFLLEKLLPAVGEHTILPDRSSDCLDALDKNFTRDDDTVARDTQERLRAFYTWLFQNNLVPTDIAKDLVFETVPEQEKKAFTPEMAVKILDNSTGDTNTFFRLYLYTGMRRSELFNCTYDKDQEGFNVLRGKNENAKRFIPRHSAIADINTEDIERIQSQWSPDYAGRLLNKWLKENIIDDPHYSLHSCRHCFNTWMVDAGVNSKLIKSILGHEDRTDDMTEYYYTYFETKDDKLDAVNSVNYTIDNKSQL